jgi:hypothetical protein
MYKKLIFVVIIIPLVYNAVLGQSNKDTIQYLQYKIDSMALASAEVTQTQNSRIKSFEGQIDTLQKIKSDLSFAIKKNRDTLMHLNAKILLQNRIIEATGIELHELKKQLLKKPKTFYDIDYGVSSHHQYEQSQTLSSSYVYDPLAKVIIEKETPRILGSKFAYRDDENLTVSIKSNQIVFKNDTLPGFQEHNVLIKRYYSYLFEDTINNKLYCVEIIISHIGGGGESFYLTQLDLITGNIKRIECKGSIFYFNSDNTYAIVGGWYNTGAAPFFHASNFSVVNLHNTQIELSREDSETLNLEWLTETSFKCQLIKYTQTIDPEVYYERPENYLTPFTLFTYKNGKWLSSEH